MRAFLIGCLVLALSACEMQRAFQNTDITGSDFAKDFRLVDHNGKTRTLADYHGKVLAVFFGFTHCPDVCPTTLSEMKAVKEALGADGDRFQVLFITVDPERDTPQLLAQYVPAFDPTFVGLTGDAEAIARTAKEFKVFYQKVPGSAPDRYSMDHSAATYIFDPEGRVRLYVRNGQGPEPLVQDIKLLLSQS
ncbi:MAG TPA: SCO family protein [Burkholderiales bacterium]|nr:SCO family protein [Burkholderiales bacterium]